MHYFTRYAPNTKLSKLPINRPTIFCQKLFTGRLERVIVSQIAHGHGCSSQGINARFLNILGDADTIEAGAGGSDNRIVHNLKGNAIDQVIGNNLDSQPKNHQVTVTYNI